MERWVVRHCNFLGITLMPRTAKCVECPSLTSLQHWWHCRSTLFIYRPVTVIMESRWGLSAFVANLYRPRSMMTASTWDELWQNDKKWLNQGDVGMNQRSKLFHDICGTNIRFSLPHKPCWSVVYSCLTETLKNTSSTQIPLSLQYHSSSHLLLTEVLKQSKEATRQSRYRHRSNTHHSPAAMVQAVQVKLDEKFWEVVLEVKRIGKTCCEKKVLICGKNVNSNTVIDNDSDQRIPAYLFCWLPTGTRHLIFKLYCQLATAIRNFPKQNLKANVWLCEGAERKKNDIYIEFETLNTQTSILHLAWYSLWALVNFNFGNFLATITPTISAAW